MQRVGVLGCGLMGSGIAQVAATAGYETTVRDVSQEILDRGRAQPGAVARVALVHGPRAVRALPGEQVNGSADPPVLHLEERPSGQRRIVGVWGGGGVAVACALATGL